MFKKFILLCLCIYNLSVQAQQPYFPDAVWQVKKPEQLKMNKQLLDSAINLALRSENKVEPDLRIANMKAHFYFDKCDIETNAH